MGFKTKFKIFELFYCMDPIFYQQIMQNYGFFFSKNIEIFEI